ncbi:MAG: YidC/Oxa1 family membrane protein insertase, partial [Clostridia bacterium]|nr:YidC/Oxa1 family membrane protein insertase [Clostridia bacterium]
MSFFDYISMPFGYLMQFCCWISPGHNYLIALIYFTIIIQAILCLLFGIKQQKNMIKQASIAPMAAALRKKYQGRDDPKTRQQMQQETMELYQKYGYSPLSGC